jgi:hypothetical protein
MRKLISFGHVLLLGSVFGLSVFSVSSIFSLLFQVMQEGFTLSSATLLTAYFGAGGLAIVLLARELYLLDRKAGRVRNRVSWFE